MTALGHLRPLLSIAIDGSLSSDRRRARDGPVTEALGQFQTFAIKEPNYNAFV
jgi:hypothetical protein